MRYKMTRLIIILILIVVVSALLVAWIDPGDDAVIGGDPYPGPETIMPYPPPETVEPPATATPKPKKDKPPKSDDYRPTSPPDD
jgi:hypothetical protein